MKFNVTVICLLFLFVAVLVPAPALAINTTNSLVQLSPDQGLSQASIKSLHLDNQGVLWIGTASGLNRFDGYQVSTFKAEGTRLDIEQIDNILADEEGNLWVTSFTEGIFRIDPQSGEVQKMLTEFENQALNHQLWGRIIWQQPGVMLITLETAIIRFDTHTGQSQVIYELPSHFTKGSVIRTLLVDQGYLYIGTTMGLYRQSLENHDVQQIHYVDADIYTDQLNVKSLLMDEDTLWVGTVSGLYPVRKQELKSLSVDGTLSRMPGVLLPERNVWKMVKIDQHIYVATDQGLLRFDHNQADEVEALVRFSHTAYGIMDDNIVDMIHDGQGSFWLASRNAGAFFWSTHALRFENVTTSQGLSNAIVWNLAEDRREDVLWIATNNGLNRYDLNSKEVQAFAVNTDTKSVYSESIIDKIELTDDGDLYLFTAVGLRFFDSKNLKFSALAPPANQADDFFDANIWGASMDFRGHLWWLMEDGFYRYDPVTNMAYAEQNLNQALAVEWASSFIPGRKDKYEIFITQPGKLWRYDLRQEQLELVIDLGVDQRDEYKTADHFAIDANGLMWVTFGTYGVVALEPDSWNIVHDLRTGQEVPTEVVYQPHASTSGAEIWMSSHAGLLSYNVVSQSFSRYTVEDGLGANEFNQPAGNVLADGRLVFGSVNGITLWDPKHFSQDWQRLPRVHITGASLLSRELSSPGVILDGMQLEYEHDDIGLQFDFSAMQFRRNKNIQYYVELTGPTKISFPPNSSNSVIFPLLASGSYKLTVTPSYLDSAMIGIPASLTFNIAYPPWASPLAYSVYSFAGLLLIAIWWQYRRRQTMRLTAAHDKAVKSERRLTLALRGSQSEVWDWEAQSNLMFASRIKAILHYENVQDQVSLDKHVELIHPADRARFTHQWQAFIKGDETAFECTYRMRCADGNWYWFADHGMATKTDKDGNVLRVTGTYRNETDQQMQARNAKIYGEAFEQIRDAMLILDQFGNIMTANSACCTNFDLRLDDLVGRDISKIASQYGHSVDLKVIARQLKDIGYWSDEIELLVKDKSLPVIANVSAVQDTRRSTFFVVTFTDITDIKNAEIELRKMANYDHLTGLPNRFLLLDRIKHACELATRMSHNVVVLFIDLDRFKQVNDSLGHDKGDELLVEVSDRLASTLREHDTVARFGGDEFVILLESVASMDDVAHIANKVIDAVSKPIGLGVAKVSVSPSIGIARYPDDADNVADLLKAADVAMYHAKNSGRGCFQYYTEKFNRNAQKLLSQENEIKRAFANKHFINYYQPIVDSDSRRLAGVELLLRWQQGDKIAGPAEFIDVAEDLGILEAMTLEAFERALIDLKQWLKVEANMYVSINVSARHFENEALVDDILALLYKHELNAAHVRLEITESVFLRDPQKAEQVMNRMRQMGLKLFLDDFGTGYSSLSYLQKLPIDVIKIDKSFVQGVGNNDNTLAIVGAILHLSDRLGLYCIAEGVETSHQAKSMEIQGCRLHQGYLYSKPVSAKEVHNYLLEFNLGQTHLSTMG